MLEAIYSGYFPAVNFSSNVWKAYMRTVETPSEKVARQGRSDAPHEEKQRMERVQAVFSME